MKANRFASLGQFGADVNVPSLLRVHGHDAYNDPNRGASIAYLIFFIFFSLNPSTTPSRAFSSKIIVLNLTYYQHVRNLNISSISSMDGDSSAKTFEAGANSALKDQDLTSGIHESVNQTVRFIAACGVHYVFNEQH